MRPIDPGALDFAVDDNDDEDEDDIDSDPENGGKARQRAMKILEVRNEMPAAGESLILATLFPLSCVRRHVAEFGVMDASPRRPNARYLP